MTGTLFDSKRFVRKSDFYPALRKLLCDDFFGAIARALTVPHAAGQRGPKSSEFCPEEVCAIFRMQLELMSGHFLLDEYLRRTDRCGRYQRHGQVRVVTRKRYYKFVAACKLTADHHKQLCDTFSRNCAAHLRFSQVPGAMCAFAADESMCTTQIKHEWVRYIPRKPKPHGVVYYALCTTLAKSKKPVLFHLIPDVAGTKQFLQHRVRRAILAC